MARSPKHPGLFDSRGEELPSHVIEIAGVDTFLYDHGDGPPVILLHGYGDTADGWRRAVPALLQSYRVIAIDIPPFGRSAAPPMGTGRLMEFYRVFYPELIDHLGVESATLIGHSLGGAMALRVALDRPELADALGLVAPAGLGTGAPWWWWLVAGNKVLWQALLRNRIPITSLAVRSGMKFFVTRGVVHDRRKIAEDIQHLIELNSNPKDFEAVLAAGRDLINQYTGTLLREAQALECPVLLVWGSHDRLVPAEHAHEFSAAVPHAQVEVLERCGHYPQIELPSIFNQIVGDFLHEAVPTFAAAPGRVGNLRR